MKTKRFNEALRSIVTFCQLARSGFVVAEINDSITKNELLACLKKETFSTFCFDLHTIGVAQATEPIIANDKKNSLLIITESTEQDPTGIVANLNFNRDWFLGLNVVVIFIFPSTVVDQLISTSYNFWSCVSLHEMFGSNFRCIISPTFFDGMDNIHIKHVSDSIAYEIISDIWEKPVLFYSVEDMKTFFKAEIANNKLYDCVFLTAQVFYKNDKFTYAYECCSFLKEHYNLDCGNKRMDIQLLRLFSNVIYKMEKYEESYSLLNSLLEILVRLGGNKDSEDDEDESRNNGNFFIESVTAQVFNNLGVILWTTENSKLAMDCYSNSAHFFEKLCRIDDYYSDDYCEVLFNLSILSLDTHDYHDALYYIEMALTYAQQNSSWHNLMRARYQLLKAYILVNYGGLYESEAIIKTSLHIIQMELSKEHKYVVEVYYVYALLKLYKGELMGAYEYALKALQIADKLNMNRILPHIQELLGEICFELKKYQDAYHLLSMALTVNKGTFSSDIWSWMYDTVQICKDKMKNGNNIDPNNFKPYF